MAPVFTVVPLVSRFAKDGSFLAEALEIIPFGITLGLLALWVVVKEKRPFSSVGFRGPRQVSRLLLGLLGGVGTMAAIGFALVGMRAFEFGGSHPTTMGVAALLPTLILLVTVGVQATTEEAVFRGYLLQVTGSQIPAWPALLLGAIVLCGHAPGGQPVRNDQRGTGCAVPVVPVARARLDLGGGRIPHRLELGAGQPSRRARKRSAARCSASRPRTRRRALHGGSRAASSASRGVQRRRSHWSALTIGSFVYFRRVAAGRQANTAVPAVENVGP